MAAVARLLTFVDLDDKDDPGPDARRMNVTARHDAVLADGSRVVLLDDRGWSGHLAVAWRGEPSEEERLRSERSSIWATQTVEDLEREARVVVGPDEPFGEETQEDVEAGHWNWLAEILRKQGVAVEAAELKALPHDVVLGERVLARVGGGRGDAG